MKLALAGDTMLGRGVAERLSAEPFQSLLAREVLEITRDADLFVLNLECCISDRGTPWPDPRKPFFFRAPPIAAHALAYLGVRCVTLANNHALDFGEDALLDTFRHLESVGIEWVGAGPSIARAREPAVLEAEGFRLGIVGLADHPPEFAAGADRAGVAFVDLARGVPDWVLESVENLDADAVLVTPHWGPNMSPAPVPRVRAAVPALLRSGATLIAGHSAHVFHGAGERVLYDMGDFLDDYAVDPRLRNDLGLLFLVTLDHQRVGRVEAVPLKLDYCHTRLAEDDDLEWIQRRFEEACAALGTRVVREDGTLVVLANELSVPDSPAEDASRDADGGGGAEE